MIELLVRVLLVAAAGGLLIAGVDRWQARSRSGGRTRLPAGVAVVVTSACRLCDAATARLDKLGVPYSTVQAGDERLGSLVVRSAPAVVRIGSNGVVEAMRTGRAAIDRIHEVVGGGDAATKEVTT